MRINPENPVSAIADAGFWRFLGKTGELDVFPQSVAIDSIPKLLDNIQFWRTSSGNYVGKRSK